MKKLLFLLLPILAFIGGALSGEMLAPKPPIPETGEMPEAGTTQPGELQADMKMAGFRFPSQFFVPVMRQGQVSSVMVLSLTIEMAEADQEAIYRQEYRLRDALLRQLLIYANSGGFDGNFTAEPRMEALRRELLRATHDVADAPVHAVLVEDITRQPSS
ncbi:MAG: hypothetical protein Q4G24_07185 [Paracoccus sp. (in: a-proteobacteria)]|uniref:hypothetical protein n=1 Tax=Paracoccus sp. TaxID=267 RepID=UPI0026DFEFD6|nr:hypothetical protein [Paracoccus sp. (in: a-proteobacteria)]MDO5621237.1 hypothetical protein [Paracoccus sp. (in: a-proteobacteria)]